MTDRIKIGNQSGSSQYGTQYQEGQIFFLRQGKPTGLYQKKERCTAGNAVPKKCLLNRRQVAGKPYTEIHYGKKERRTNNAQNPFLCGSQSNSHNIGLSIAGRMTVDNA